RLASHDLRLLFPVQENVYKCQTSHGSREISPPRETNRQSTGPGRGQSLERHRWDMELDRARAEYARAIADAEESQNSRSSGNKENSDSSDDESPDLTHTERTPQELEFLRRIHGGGRSQLDTDLYLVKDITKE